MDEQEYAALCAELDRRAADMECAKSMEWASFLRKAGSAIRALSSKIEAQRSKAETP